MERRHDYYPTRPASGLKYNNPIMSTTKPPVTPYTSNGFEMPARARPVFYPDARTNPSEQEFLLVASGDTLRALKIGTGPGRMLQKWHRSPQADEQGQQIQGVAVDAGIIYGVIGQHLFAQESSKGREAWPPFQAEAKLLAPVVATIDVHLIDEKGRHYQIDKTNGRQIQSSLVMAGQVMRPPVTDGRYLYYVCAQQEHHWLLAIDLQTGAEIWRLDLRSSANWTLDCFWPHGEVVDDKDNAAAFDFEQGTLCSDLQFVDGFLCFAVAGKRGDAVHPFFVCLTAGDQNDGGRRVQCLGVDPQIKASAEGDFDTQVIERLGVVLFYPKQNLHPTAPNPQLVAGAGEVGTTNGLIHYLVVPPPLSASEQLFDSYRDQAQTLSQLWQSEFWYGYTTNQPLASVRQKWQTNLSQLDAQQQPLLEAIDAQASLVAAAKSARASARQLQVSQGKIRNSFGLTENVTADNALWDDGKAHASPCMYGVVGDLFSELGDAVSNEAATTASGDAISFAPWGIPESPVRRQAAPDPLRASPLSTLLLANGLASWRGTFVVTRGTQVHILQLDRDIKEIDRFDLGTEAEPARAVAPPQIGMNGEIYVNVEHPSANGTSYALRQYRYSTTFSFQEIPYGSLMYGAVKAIESQFGFNLLSAQGQGNFAPVVLKGSVTASWPESWERWTIVTVDQTTPLRTVRYGDTLSLQSFFGQFLSVAENDQGFQLQSVVSLQDWEKWKLVNPDDAGATGAVTGVVAFQHLATNRYLSALGGGDNGLTLVEVIDEAERWRLLP